MGRLWRRDGEGKSPWLVPTTSTAPLPRSLREHLYWMMQKDNAAQDVFLIGQPGPLRRRLAVAYCVGGTGAGVMMGLGLSLDGHVTITWFDGDLRECVTRK